MAKSLQLILASFYVAVLSIDGFVRCQDEELLKSKELFIDKLANASSQAFQARCNATCSTCVSSACSSKRPVHSSTCTKLYGDTEVHSGGCTYQCPLRKLDYTTSNILTSSEKEHEELVEERCWTDSLDSVFMENNMEDSRSGKRSLRWQYFATASGMVRLYPAHTLQTCHVINARIRPWYVAATSGPKNVILILDVSASMLNDGRLGIAQDAAVTVIETLTNVDYATVVLFSDSARQLLVPDQIPHTLLRASYNNISLLSEAVKNISGDSFGSTNFEASFAKAFDILDANPPNCHTAILFLTDGFPNKGRTSEDDLIGLVQSRNTHHNATIFTYTFGSNSGASLTRAIACETNGVYTQINDNTQLRKQLSLYYDYFASLRQTDSVEVAWVEPYIDAVGAGLLVTASKAIYRTDFTPARLLGVVGVDVLVSDLKEAFEKQGKNYEEVINFLSSKNSCPSTRRFNQSVLDRIRVQGGGVPCGSCEDCEMALPASCAVERVGFCDYDYQRYKSDSDLYREESCCFSQNASFPLLQCDSGVVPSPCKLSMVLFCFVSMFACYLHL